MCVLVESLPTVPMLSQDTEAKAAAIKLGSEVGAENVPGEELHEESKSVNLRSNQIETKDDVGQVSTHLVIFLGGN